MAGVIRIRSVNGEPYNVNTDGFTYLHDHLITRNCSSMLKSLCVSIVGGYLQSQFNQAMHYKKNAPFSSNISRRTIKEILNRSCRQTLRYQRLKEQGATPDEIRRSFRTPHEMTLFTYHGDIDTVMTPIDSIRYYKSFLRSAFVSMDPTYGRC